MASPGLIAVGAAGAALLLITLVDLFVTIFNYDGFTFLAGRLHKLTWQVLRLTSAAMPASLRRGYLSLGFEDVSPSSGLYRALVDLEAIVGIATFTLALTYVLAAFETLGTLHRMHGRVRRHAVEPNRPETIVARYYHGGQPGEISNLLAALTEDLEE